MYLHCMVVCKYLSIVMDIDLLQEGTGEGEDVVERLVPEGAGHFAMFGERAHGLSQVHLHHKVVQNLHSNHTVFNRPLQVKYIV